MNYLSVQDLSKSYGIQTLFEGINFGVDQGQKIALVARNGTGKTTILRAIAGVEPADNGEVVFRKDLQIGFLQQEADFGSFTTVYDALYGSENLMLSAIKEYELAILKPENSEAFQTAFEKMDRLNAWDYEVKVKTILSKLKLEELKQEISVLSGGQRKRLFLSQAIDRSTRFFNS
jgi:ATP-binding cassette subfamily F protein uup